MKKRIIDPKKPTKEQMTQIIINEKTTSSLIQKLTKQHIIYNLDILDNALLIKHKKINKKQWIKYINVMSHREIQKGIKTFKLSYNDIKNSNLQYIYPIEAIHAQKLSQRQIIKLINKFNLIDKYNLIPIWVKEKLSYKSKYQLNLNNPKYYSRKIYINLISRAIREK